MSVSLAVPLEPVLSPQSERKLKVKGRISKWPVQPQATYFVIHSILPCLFMEAKCWIFCFFSWSGLIKSFDSGIRDTPVCKIVSNSTYIAAIISLNVCVPILRFKLCLKFSCYSSPLVSGQKVMNANFHIFCEKHLFQTFTKNGVAGKEWWILGRQLTDDAIFMYFSEP